MIFFIPACGGKGEKGKSAGDTPAPPAGGPGRPSCTSRPGPRMRRVDQTGAHAAGGLDWSAGASRYGCFI
ncbi:hypothetical protein KDA_41640 [Dictyobacter alpinus]|uniref:Uncharacterized protein n=1 Tax=Dictyobacter alpinus TaxID=2014873 RepID=A0A402BBL2_9CHLR|nr:hypothetical protein KDA_41640 [Dictyobacter alpinus]